MNDYSNCENCFEVLLDSQVLPCGIRLCNDCKHYISQKRFKCSNCDSFHPVGLKQNSITSVSINSEPKSPTTSLSHKRKRKVSKQILEQNKQLNEIESKVKALRATFLNGDDLIKEYCSELIRQVQLVKEEKMLQIEDSANRMLTQISDFELKSLETFSLVNSEIFNVKLNRTKQELNEHSRSLFKYKQQSTKISKRKLKALKSRIISLHRATNFQDLALQNNEILTYKANYSSMDANILGCLRIKPSNTIKYENLFKRDYSKQFHRFTLKLFKKNIQEANEDSTFNILDTKLLPNTDLLVLAEHLSFNFCQDCLYLILIDPNGNWKRHILLPTMIDLKHVQMDIDLRIHIGSDRICLNYHAHSEDIIQVLDLNLEKLNRLVILDEKKVIGVSDKKIYVLSRRNKYAIEIYTWELDFVSTLCQMNDSSKSFYVPKYCKQMHLVENDFEQKFMIFELAHQIRILDLSSGNTKVVREGNISKTSVDMLKNIIIFKQEKLVYYDLSGYLLKEIQLGDCRYKLNGDYFYSCKHNSDLYYFDHEYYIFSNL